MEVFKLLFKSTLLMDWGMIPDKAFYSKSDKILYMPPRSYYKFEKLQRSALMEIMYA